MDTLFLTLRAAETADALDDSDDEVDYSKMDLVMSVSLYVIIMVYVLPWPVFVTSVCLGRFPTAYSLKISGK